MKSTIIVIPAEGDSAETEQWYIEALENYYRERGKEVKVVTFEFTGNLCRTENLVQQVEQFFALHSWIERAEVHAQGGLGASIACQMIDLYPEAVRRVFFVGGAPSNAMTGLAKIFHRYISLLWYFSGIPYFADDPNPQHDPVIDQIRAASTAIMRAHPLRYCHQLTHIGNWKLPSHWQMPDECEGYFVPNGETVRPHWWDNSYDNDRAIKVWAEHGVHSTWQPGENFSFYSMMPAVELFKVMDEVRNL